MAYAIADSQRLSLYTLAKNVKRQGTALESTAELMLPKLILW
jgi:hypothetical protein